MKDLLIRIGYALEAFLTCIPRGDKQVIVSKYNSYEWITTKHCPSIFLLKFAYYLRGWKVYEKYNSNIGFELLDPNKDQVTYHSPLDDLR